MPEPMTQTIAFDGAQAEFIKMCLESGQYQNASEVIYEGLRLLAYEDKFAQLTLDQARKMIVEGAESAERGELVDAEVVFQNLRMRREEMRRSAKA